MLLGLLGSSCIWLVAPALCPYILLGLRVSSSLLVGSLRAAPLHLVALVGFFLPSGWWPPRCALTLNRWFNGSVPKALLSLYIIWVTGALGGYFFFFCCCVAVGLVVSLRRKLKQSCNVMCVRALSGAELWKSGRILADVPVVARVLSAVQLDLRRGSSTDNNTL